VNDQRARHYDGSAAPFGDWHGSVMFSVGGSRVEERTEKAQERVSINENLA
jgi:hypothetical protein